MSVHQGWLLPAAFVLLGLIWGSSFAWIMIAVDDIPPASLVAWRMGLGAVGMLVLLAFIRVPVPRGVRMDVRLMLGTALVLAGIIVVTLRYDAVVSRVPSGARE